MEKNAEGERERRRKRKERETEEKMKSGETGRLNQSIIQLNVIQPSPHSLGPCSVL